MIFGRRITKHTDAGLKTQILDHDLGQPVIRSEYKSSSIKQYARDNLVLRTETTSYHTPDLGVNKGVEHLPELRQTMATANDRYLDVQQDVLETFVDRGQLERLRQPTVSPSGRRTPGLKLDDPRLLAVLQALTCFALLAGRGRFRTTDLHATVAEALGKTTETLHAGATALRPGEAARQGAGGAGRRHTVVPAAVGGLSDRGAVPEAVPPDLRSADGRDHGTRALGRATAARATCFARSLVRGGRSRLEPTLRVRRRYGWRAETIARSQRTKRLEKREQNPHFSSYNGLGKGAVPLGIPRSRRTSLSSWATPT